MKSEKIFFEVEGSTVVGILTTPKTETNNAVLLLHGFKGTKEERGDFEELAFELAKNNIASLRIDMRGTKESETATFQLKDMTIYTEKEDALAAVDFLQIKGFGKIGVIGLSMGGLITTLINSERDILVNVLWSPAIFWKAERHLEGKEKELEEKGYIDCWGVGTKEYWQVGKSFFDTVGKKNEEEIINKIKVPTLIIQGDKDREVHVKGNKKVFEKLKCKKELKIIAGADHIFTGHIREVIKLTVEWVSKWLK
jgi:esterase/lipase